MEPLIYFSCFCSQPNNTQKTGHFFFNLEFVESPFVKTHQMLIFQNILTIALNCLHHFRFIPNKLFSYLVSLEFMDGHKDGSDIFVVSYGAILLLLIVSNEPEEKIVVVYRLAFLDRLFVGNNIGYDPVVLELESIKKVFNISSQSQRLIGNIFDQNGGIQQEFDELQVFSETLAPIRCILAGGQQRVINMINQFTDFLNISVYGIDDLFEPLIFSGCEFLQKLFVELGKIEQESQLINGPWNQLLIGLQFAYFEFLQSIVIFQVYLVLQIKTLEGVVFLEEVGESNLLYCTQLYISASRVKRISFNKIATARILQDFEIFID